jgi:hypothetical protein
MATIAYTAGTGGLSRQHFDYVVPNAEVGVAVPQPEHGEGEKVPQGVHTYCANLLAD